MQGSQATQEVLRGCVCDRGDSPRDVWHTGHRPLTFVQNTREHEPCCVCKHMGTSALTQAGCGPATGLTWPRLPLAVWMLLAKSPNPAAHQHHTYILFPIPSFFFSSYSQWMKKNKMGEKKGFPNLPSSIIKSEKRPAIFLWDC